MDYVIIGIVIMLGIASIFLLNIENSKMYDSKYAEIYSNNELIKTIYFDENTEKTIEIDNGLGKNSVKIQMGHIHIDEADCPNQICISDGEIQNVGEILVCLPNKVLIEIKGNNKTVVDAISD